MNFIFPSKSSKLLISFFFLIASYASVAQTNQIVLENKETQKKKSITENKRIKVITNDGKKYIGKFSILDEKNIMIDGNSIALDSIATIQKRSTFSSIIRPIIIVNGVAIVIMGVAGAVAGGYGYLFAVTAIPIGTPMVLIPLLASKHKNENWSYTIERVE